MPIFLTMMTLSPVPQDVQKKPAHRRFRLNLGMTVYISMYLYSEILLGIHIKEHFNFEHSLFEFPVPMLLPLMVLF